jgi:ATPase subunit of ABC transporter with duplicated ATPase domains
MSLDWFHHQLIPFVARFAEAEKISPPLLQLSKISFGYTPDKLILKDIEFDVGLDSRIAVVGANGAGKSTLYAPICFSSVL